jgi:hypothetical protein
VLLDAQLDTRNQGGQVRIAEPGRAYTRLLALTRTTPLQAG